MRTGNAVGWVILVAGVGSGMGVGCSKSDEPAPPVAASASARATAAPPMPKAEPTTDPWDDLDLTCDKVLPRAFRDKNGLTGMQVNESTVHKGSVSCAFVDPKSPTHQRNFKYECKGHPAERATGAGLQAMAGAFHGMAKDARDLTSLGRVAMVGTAMSVPQLWVLDDKTPCRVTIAFGMEKTLPTEELGHAVMDQFHEAVAGVPVVPALPH